VSACTVCGVCGVVSKVGRVVVLVVGVVCLAVCFPFGGSTEGAHQSLCPARQYSGFSSVALLLVVERIVCAVMAAPEAAPEPVAIDGRCPAPLVDSSVS
jgi:hypothetical protein